MVTVHLLAVDDEQGLDDRRGRDDKRDPQERHNVERLGTEPGTGRRALHHVNTPRNMAAVEVIGKGIRRVGQCLAYKQRLVVGQRDTLTQHEVVGLVLVDVAQAAAEHVDDGVPPLHGLDNDEQQDVERVAQVDMCPLVQQDGAAEAPLPAPPEGGRATKGLVVGLADIDAAHPAEGRAVAHVAIDRDAVLLTLPPQTAAAHGPAYLHQLADAQAEYGGHTRRIDDGEPLLPSPGGGLLLAPQDVDGCFDDGGLYLINHLLRVGNHRHLCEAVGRGHPAQRLHQRQQ